MEASVTKRPDHLRVGIFLDTFHQPSWIGRIAEDIQKSELAKTVLVVRNAAADAHRVSPIERLRNQPDLALFWLYQAVDEQVFGQRGRTPRIDARSAPQRQDPFASVDIRPLVADASHIDVRPRQTKLSDYFGEDDLGILGSFDLDVILRFGFRILRGRVLEAARYGVWSYHHGDNETNRGGPAGFWEVFNKEPVTGSILQRLSEDLDNGQVLYRSYSSTDTYSVARNRAHYFLTSSAFVIRALGNLYESRSDTPTQTVDTPAFRPYSNRLYRRPKNGEMARLLARHCVAVAKERAEHVLRPEQWGLAYQLSNDVPTLYRFKHLSPPQGHSWADPFPVFKDGSHYIFFEEVLPSRGLGRISVMRHEQNGSWSQPVPVLEPEYHVSYPHIFEWRGDLFMVPETVAARRVELYRCREFPTTWDLTAILLDNVSAVDATVAEIDGVWWMFVNIAPEGTVDYSELYIFWADTPLGPWQPHRRNPVKSDARSTRSAGRLWLWNGELLRPAQDCGQRYGYATTIQRIEALDRQTFREREVGRIEPSWDTDILATHTFNMVPGLTTVDVLRRRRRGRG